MKINNQITADIQFIGSCIQRTKISNNIIRLDDDAVREFGIDIDVPEIERNESLALIGIVNLGIIVNVKDKKNNKKTKIDILIQGCFSSTNPELSEDKFKAMLYINGGSALYSMARSFICNISANIYESGKLLLPMINIIEFIKEKIKEEKQAKPKAASEQLDKTTKNN
ncbi:hypothetical protein [Caproiciproducens galactitolivorans]|uniref:hypothetical protein n=1 Tax=Caproiciproducens galactitolivorans TaxID=642589 RepID=UPI00240984B3|nr:hypothetical protein [Caproiciproducens galactitolivorans]